MIECENAYFYFLTLNLNHRPVNQFLPESLHLDLLLFPCKHGFPEGLFSARFPLSTGSLPSASTRSSRQNLQVDEGMEQVVNCLLPF